MAKQQLQKWELKFVTELEPLEGASPVFHWCAPYSNLHREWACGDVVEINGRTKVWLIESQTATGTMARCTLTSHYTTMQELRNNNPKHNN